jgi:DNA-directed RNA polymerase specialized sigma24 family protein
MLRNGLLMTAPGRLRTLDAMERADAIARLPATYAEVIELLDAGASDKLIAERLGVDAAAVGPLTTVALAKLARLLSA